tara:strand:- start:1901 stop:2344 length:444 start_codon:yes stop_codon:yes gene_type:complete
MLKNNSEQHEVFQSAILRLQSMAAEKFAIMKSVFKRPHDENTVDLLVKNAVSMAQIEMAMASLQQRYAPQLIKNVNRERAAEAKASENAGKDAEEQQESQQEQEPITEKDLLDRSSAFRKSEPGKKLAQQQDKTNESKRKKSTKKTQ